MEHGGIEAATSKFVCFMTLTWACPKLHRFAEYVKPLERMVWVNAPSGTDSRISGRKFCHVVMKPAVAGQKSRSELGHYIQFSDETVRIHLGKAYNFWYPTHCRNPTSNEWQPVSRCFFGTVTYSYLLTSEENWVLYDTPKHDRYLFVTTGFCASHYMTNLYNPARLCSVSGGLADKWYTMSYYQRAKPPLWDCSRNRHWSRVLLFLHRIARLHVAHVAVYNKRQIGWETLYRPP